MAGSVFLANRAKTRFNNHDLSKLQYHECKEYGHVVSHCKKRNVCVYGKQSGHISVNAGTDLENEQLKINFKAYEANSGGEGGGEL